MLAEPPPRSVVTQSLRRVRDSAFGLFLLLVFLSPTLQNGPWSWWRIMTLPWFGGKTRGLGVFALVPVVLTVLWAITLWRKARHRAVWQWGEWQFLVPLGLLSLFILIGVRTMTMGVWWSQLALLGAMWLSYFYILNERPDMRWVWGTVLTVQGVVALAQFGLQHEVGLGGWGEPILDINSEGTSVFMVRGVVWLRAYGLTFHPNALGALLSVLLLIWMAMPLPLTHPGRTLYGIAFVAGVGGLLVTFSRGSWLAFAIGVGVWLTRRAAQIGWRRVARRALQASPVVLLVGVLALPYADFATSRWVNLESPLEVRSIHERSRDIAYSLQLLRDHPWGVGVTNFVPAARAIDTEALIVHNAFLLTGTETGWAGLAVVAWLIVSGLRQNRSPYQPAWVAWCVSNTFDIVLWTTTGLRGAVIVGVLAGLIQVLDERSNPSSTHTDQAHR